MVDGWQQVAAVGQKARERLLNASGLTQAKTNRPPLQVLYTVDTEISLGGALQDPNRHPIGPDVRIWGQTDRGAFGVGKMMDLLEKYGHVGVFFFEVNARNIVSERELASAAKGIHERGHEVQLHVHPEFNFEGLDAARANPSIVPDFRLSSLSSSDRIKELNEGCAAIESWTGHRPTAFRAGGFGVGDEVFDALRQAGMQFDSSANIWARAEGLSEISEVDGNDACTAKNQVIEIPVTCFDAKWPRGGLRQLDFAATSISEMIWILEAMYAAGARTVNGLTHSFRLLRTTNPMYQGARSDPVNIYRLDGLFRYLHEHNDRFQVVGFNGLQNTSEWLSPSPADKILPRPPRWSSGLRLAVQAIKDRGAI